MTVPIQHLRSGVADKRPNPTNLSYGQIAINYSNVDPAVYIKDGNGALIKIAPTFVGNTTPNGTPHADGHAGNSVGETWLDTSQNPPVFKVFNGTQFVAPTGSNGAIGGGRDQILVEFDQTVTTNYTITQNKNAVGAGPMSVNDGIELQVPAGSTFALV